MLFRYPGSKAKIAERVIGAFPDEMQLALWSFGFPCYCEPFVGSGAVAWEVLSTLDGRKTRVILNDRDPGIAALWQSVRDDHRYLAELVMGFTPSAERFYEFKAADGDPASDVTLRGFRKLALHQMSYSGLGFMSGGPLGGRGGSSQYDPACRWRPNRLARKIKQWHDLMRRFRYVEVTNDDYADVLGRLPANAFAYLDPPYYEQGPHLYRYGMEGDCEHARLADILRRARFEWALSYDDHPRVRELYGWACIGSFEMTPTVQTSRSPTRRKNREVIIRSPKV